jgi:lipid II isoglutaminyl synthase (glutamine-hydrolysing)
MPMTKSVGRHASHDTGETLILPAVSGLDQPGYAPPPAGRHAFGRPADVRRPDVADRPAAARPGAADRPAAARPGAAYRPETAGVPWAADLPEPAASRRGPQVRIVWVYPDLLSTYGDRGNLLVLSRRALLRDVDVEAVEVKSDEPVPENGDIYLLGGGEDLPQILAASRLRADGGLARAAERGAVVFAVCAGYQLLGRQFGGVDGEPVAGLGILDVTSGRGSQRGVGEIVADVDPALGVPTLTGFENHQGVTRIGPGARPLARVALGVGNGDGTEGAYAGNVLGTYLHGPALARNPGLADLLLGWALGPLQPLTPAAEDWAFRLRDERLAATAS